MNSTLLKKAGVGYLYIYSGFFLVDSVSVLLSHTVNSTNQEKKNKSS